MLKLICGTSGAGKTALLTEQIRTDLQNGIRCFLLVPEQQAYISERDFPSLLPQNASLLFHIVSFSGLANAVGREYGGVTQACISHGLRTLLMWESLRKLSPLLKQYGRSTGNDLSFPSLMLQTVTELRMNGIEETRLEEIANGLSEEDPLKRKLLDLALVDAVFHADVEECFGEDPADALLRLAKQLEKHPYFIGCHVYLDSFAGFTAQEYAVIAQILKQADEVTVALCTDAFHSSLPQFSGANETAKRLLKLANLASVPVKKQVLSNEKKGRPLSLRTLEQDLWRFSVKKDARVTLTDEEKENVRLISCSDIYEESEAAAWNILQLVQSGMHYGEIAIVVRDVESYRGVLDAALEKYGIPYFLSERTDLSSKPLSRLILSALHAVANGFPARDIMTLIKTDLVGVSLKDASLFEEYCETWHITGSRFTDTLWSMNPDGLTTERSERANVILESANRTRTLVMEPLLALATSMKAAKTMAERCRALYDYLQRLSISEQLSLRARRELEEGRGRDAGETLRLYQTVTDSLATLSDLLPDTVLSVEEFATALTLFFSESDLGSIPNVHDCVIVGSAPTLRVENIKASLLLGLCEGEFPRAVSDDGILTEGDKLRLEKLGLLLDSRESTRSCEEMLYVYRAISKPTEKLLLFTVTSSGTDADRTPSLAFSRAAFLLDKTPEQFDPEPIRARLLQEHADVKQQDTAVEHLPPLPKGTVLHLSQTKIKDFVLCPYRYYSTYVLKNRSVKDSSMAYSDDGVFLHYIFEHFLRASLNSDGTLSLPPKDRIEPLTDEIVNDYLQSIFPFPLSEMDPRQLHAFYRLRRFALKMLEEIIGELEHSRFVPTLFEQEIGKGEGGFPAVEFPLRDGCRVLLRGTIDRVDLQTINGQTYVRVVDYKSGSSSQFAIKDVQSGMDLQLVLYLYALLAADPSLRAAGAQYLYAVSKDKRVNVCHSGFLLDEEAIVSSCDTSANGTYVKDLKKLGADVIAELQTDMRNAVVSVAERILAGEAEKKPSEAACRLCPIRMHCDKAHNLNGLED